MELQQYYMHSDGKMVKGKREGAHKLRVTLIKVEKIKAGKMAGKGAGKFRLKALECTDQ